MEFLDQARNSRLVPLTTGSGAVFICDVTVSICSLSSGSGLRERKKMGEGSTLLLQPCEKLASLMGVFVLSSWAWALSIVETSISDPGMLC